MSVKSPTETDKIIGVRIRQCRNALGMSQEALGDRLGISFQQLQKYEKGTNRVNASRLQAIAHALGVRVSYFFPDHTETQLSSGGVSLDVVLTDPECLDIAAAFHRIESPTMRRALLQLVRAADPASK